MRSTSTVRQEKGSHCERGDLNPHPPLSGLDPKSSASANSATLASVLSRGRRSCKLRTRRLGVTRHYLHHLLLPRVNPYKFDSCTHCLLHYSFREAVVTYWSFTRLIDSPYQPADPSGHQQRPTRKMTYRSGYEGARRDSDDDTAHQKHN